VPIIEEVFFRGALTGLVARAGGRWWALIFVSAIYSAVHFLKPLETVVAARDVHWLSGFTLIPLLFVRLGDLQLVIMGFTVLFILGLCFGYATLRTRGLWLAIGLHAGIILGKFSFTKLAKPDRSVDLMPWFGNDPTVGIIGIGAILVMILLFAMVWMVVRGEKG